ncbi:ep1-like glycoprotein 2 [Quercus suber]|uniref:Ep1-like glycoprotein 2 n=1 Tax=Quercus suber TaxID=58331 RepID=A0AAW0MBU7_QUESU
MCTSWASCAVLLYLVLFLTPCCPILVTALPAPSYLTPNASTSWTNSLSAPDSVKFDDGSFARIILAREFDHYFYKIGCGCGFFYNQTRNTHVFAIFTLSYVDGDAVNISSNDPKVVWFANPENSFSINATLQLTSEKGLVLKDANGTTVWSTNIFSKSVAALNFTDMCNLQLLDDKSSTVWQSSDHPTDTLVVGQKLVAGQQLTSQGGLFSLHVTRQGIFAYVSSNPPQRYFTYTSDNTSYIQFLEDRMTFSSNTNKDFPLPSSNFFPNWFMRLEADNGRLKVYDTRWGEVFDFFDRLKVLPCLFPTVCGNYGICSNGQCSCPRPTNATSYFQATEETQPDHGCSLITPLSCEASKNHILLELQNITYFPFTQDHPGINPELQDVNLDSCKQACLKNCSCKAAFYNLSKSLGNCYLLSQIFSLKAIDQVNANLKVYIKVQNVSSSDPPRQQTNHKKKKQIIYSEDMQLHRAEVVSMMRVAAWCLQNDFTRRPSMSMVVKVLEGDVNVESDLDYFFSNPSLPNMRAGVENQEVHIVTTTPLLPSVLSGPRKEHSDFSLSHLYCFIIEIEEDQLLDLVDKSIEDMQLYRAKVLNMMGLQHEGAANVKSDLDYFFFNPSLPNMTAVVENQEVHIVATTPLFPSILPRPRLFVVLLCFYLRTHA